jgi:hypothetical protein
LRYPTAREKDETEIKQIFAQATLVAGYHRFAHCDLQHRPHLAGALAIATPRSFNRGFLT